MRDSNGVARPITVIAFDANGVPTTGNLKVFITDTFKFARVTANNFVIGDSLGQTRLVGQVDGLQTQVTNIFVTLAPAKIERTNATLDDTLRPPLGGDSASTVATKVLSVRLLSENDSASQGMIVRYRIVNAPAPRNALQPAAFITSGGKLSSVDTTDQSGAASRDVTVIANFIADGEVRAGTKIDSVVVEVSAKYKGLPVPGSPLTISLPIRAGSSPATP